MKNLNSPTSCLASPRYRFALVFFALLALLLTPNLFSTQYAVGQEQQDAEAEAAEALANIPDQTPTEENAPAPPPPGSDSNVPDVNMLELLVAGSWPMVPIVAMLILVITFIIERMLALRRIKVLPHELNSDLGRLAAAPGGFDPRKAYRACQRYPSAASRVIRAMLLKIGRPHSEVEHAVMEANEREAAGLYANVRWLNLAAAVTPLMGLFGTVWGMINAFYATARLPEGHSKAEVLADGIVLALVTTLGGLFVAIPAAIAAHFFEGRIQALFREIDELLFSLLPQVERYEGKLRVSRELFETDQAAGDDAKKSASAGSVVAQVAAEAKDDAASRKQRSKRQDVAAEASK